MTHYPDPNSLDDDRILALELVRATEAAAVAAARFLGRGDEDQVDAAAVDALRPVLGTIPMRGLVVIGEGEKDDAPMLYSGEHVGGGTGPRVDVAIDPVDGAGLTAKSLPNALSVIAVADRGRDVRSGALRVHGQAGRRCRSASAVDFDAPIEDTLATIARVRGKSVADVTVALLDRPRHVELADRIRVAGARIKFLIGGDVAGRVDGAAAGVRGRRAGRGRRHAGGHRRGLRDGLHGRRDVRQAGAAGRARNAGRSWTPAMTRAAVLTTSDLVSGDNAYFAATGVTGGDVLRGVRYSADLAVSHSITMRSRTGVVRLIESRHRLSTTSIVLPRV